MYTRNQSYRGPSGPSRRPSQFRGRAASRFGNNRNQRGGGSRGGFRGEHLDPSRFVHKAVITETIEHFIPEHEFKDFQIDERLKQAIIAKGYTVPTPIQDRTIPYILKGSDVVGIANTGTGKTGAFLIPLINKVLSNKTENVLVVVPTRELALQIQDELKTFITGFKIFSVCCTGGSSIGKQISELRYHNNFIIGTPGRLKDLVKRKFINLANFKTVVLDEADRMLDMGFI